VEELFLTFLGPGWMSRFIFDEHHGDEQRLIDALAEAAEPFYRAIVDAGLVLQIDVTVYRKDVERRLDALHGAIEGIPEDRIRLHPCWGSWHGRHTGASSTRR
jgi:5-methyltetrahydropteroyltriglutamate--homocysteine methyltransferase